MDERRLDEHDPNPLAGEPYPVLVLDERDGVSVPYRERDALVHWHEDLQLVVVSQGVMDIDTPLGHFSCGEGRREGFAPRHGACRFCAMTKRHDGHSSSRVNKLGAVRSFQPSVQVTGG